MGGICMNSLDSFLKEAYSPDHLRHVVYGDNVFLDMLAPVRDAIVAAPNVPLAATMALAGLGFLIARRNAVAAQEGVSETWLKAATEWLVALVRGMFAQEQA